MRRLRLIPLSRPLRRNPDRLPRKLRDFIKRLVDDPRTPHGAFARALNAHLEGEGARPSPRAFGVPARVAEVIEDAIRRVRTARARRRNLDVYVDEQGRKRPIRGSPGYSDFQLKLIPPPLTAGYISREEEDARDWWRAELRRAIREVSPSGIARHGDRALGWEFRERVPESWRSSRGLPADEVADLLKREYPWLGVESERDLYDALAEL